MIQEDLLVKDSLPESPTDFDDVSKTRTFNFLRNSFRFYLLLASSLISGCISSVRATKDYTTYEQIGEEIRTIQIPPRTEMLLSAIHDGYLDIKIKKTCETRQVKRTVEQALYHEERETQKLGTEFAAAGGAILVGAILLAMGSALSDKAEKMPENTEEEKKEKDDEKSSAAGATLMGGGLIISAPILAGHGIYTAFKAIDTTEYRDSVRQKNVLLSSRQEDCTTAVPLILRTSSGEIFPLGVTDDTGHLRIKLEDVLPERVLTLILRESLSIEIGRI